MARSRATSSSMALAIALLFMTFVDQSYGQMKVGFYNGKCGNSDVEQIIFDIVKTTFQRDRKTVAALLRLQFHDCFVRGCDASILLDGSSTEKTAGPNGSVRGYTLIDTCKGSLERRCPGVVSCADIIAIATRVSVFLAGGKWYNVETGRRDGTISRASEANSNLPGPTTPVNVAVQLFASRNLTTEDFVLLLGGGHTVGFLHCSFFLDRLYNFRNTGRADPTMNLSTLSSLRRTCPRTGSNSVVAADQTTGSSLTVDNGFYKAIKGGKGVLQIDQQISSDPLTRNIVTRLASTNDFANKFGSAMVKLGRVGVLTGKQGQVRKSCRAVNSS
ncbi:hypothetical protein Cgig2_000897 [Carnegiea gigantea]|uniref:Peroxidase n=1 Tax=Carnegiea gigantea TaxID=171969 RepID=A0A9Q1GWZ6_9CARY|nr:hypothetical protein Cgig2_000897 [Carnegiea gigantea]